MAHRSRRVWVQEIDGSMGQQTLGHPPKRRHARRRTNQVMGFTRHRGIGQFDLTGAMGGQAWVSDDDGDQTVAEPVPQPT